MSAFVTMFFQLQSGQLEISNEVRPTIYVLSVGVVEHRADFARLGLLRVHARSYLLGLAFQ